MTYDQGAFLEIREFVCIKNIIWITSSFGQDLET